MNSFCQDAQCLSLMLQYGVATSMDISAGAGMHGVGGLSSFGDLNLLADSGSPAPRPVLLKNPMHRSGLALAGAQATLEAWKRGQVPPMDNDAIVTAEEVG